ncbi:MAG TPA: hypothetical protein V6C97_06245 [Oculatellaceae cyanobacterium]
MPTSLVATPTTWLSPFNSICHARMHTTATATPREEGDRACECVCVCVCAVARAVNVL